MTDTPAKLDLKSMSITNDQKAMLKQLFPQVFNEDKIDFDKLRRTLGEDIDEGEERFGMAWPGKNECFKVIQESSVATLKPDKEESIGWDSTENLFIEGDNLEVLKLLQRSYYGKIKMIYIDPPYNTGNEFVYPDKYSESLETYLAYTGQVDTEGVKFSTNTEAEGRFHSKWINMMYPRLFLARNLLTENGLIFVSIDNNEVKSLRHILDDIFGEECFVEQIVWKNKYGAGAATKGFISIHEYILCYSRFPITNVQGTLSKSEIQKHNKQDSKFNTRGSYRTQPVQTKSLGDRPNLIYPVKYKGQEIWPNKQWVWSKERMLRAIENDDVEFTEKDGKYSIRSKQYLKDENGRIRKGKPLSLLNGPFTQEGTKEIRELLPEDVFPFPKPSALMKYLFELVVNEEEEDDFIVLDFFAGSCTTANSIFNLNKQNGGRRKFILVQLPEPCDEESKAFKAGFKTIADIGKERIRRVIKKIEEEQAAKAKDAKGALPGMAEEQAELDLGFKVFKLDKSNFNIWDGAVDEDGDVSGQIEMFIDHIDPEASDEDILYEILLKSGFELTTKIEELDLAGKKVYSIADNALLICLDRKLSKEVITEMTRLQPARVVCLDAGFADNDQLKTNAVQIMKSHDVEDFRTV